MWWVKNRDKIEAITKVFSGIAIANVATTHDEVVVDNTVAKMLAKNKYAPALKMLVKKPIFIAWSTVMLSCLVGASVFCALIFISKVLIPKYIR